MNFLTRIVTVLLFTALPSVTMANFDDANNFVKSVSDRTLEIVSSSTLSEEEKEIKLSELFYKTVDTDWIAKFALGRYYNDSTVEQIEEYKKIYREYLVNNYIPKFKRYTNQEFQLNETFNEGNGEYLVSTIIKDPAGPDIRINYKIRKSSDSSFKIYDIIAEGVSLIATQRSDFSSILSRKGIVVLTKKLKAKVEK